MDNSDIKVDPIRLKYYRPLELAEMWSDWLFLLSAALSLLEPLIVYGRGLIQGTFAISVAAVFVLSWVIRFYLAPRANGKRFQDFLSHAYGVNLSDEQTTGYYTSDVPHPAKRIAAQLIENTFYSKDTARRMALRERAKVIVYVLLFAAVILNRSTALGVVAVATQIIFSEQILSKWLRTEWFYHQCERTYDDLFRLFRAEAKPLPFASITQELLTRYETAKANACVTLSEKIFNKRQEENKEEWQRIKTALGI